MTQIFRLDKIAEVGSGNSAPQKEELFKGGTLPFVRTSDVGTIHIGSIESSRDLLTPEGVKGLKLQPAGTILFPKSGASTFLNHRVLLSKNAYVSSHLATIKADNELTIDRYLFYFLQTIDARNLCQDQAYPSLNRDQIGGIEVPVPSLEKQHEIVKKLDSAFAEIDLLERNLGVSEERANQLLQSILSSAFTPLDESNLSANQDLDMRLVQLGTIAEVVAGQSPEGIYYNSNSDGMPFYQGKKEFGDRFLGAPTTWTTKVTKLAEPGDILMSVRAPVGPINFSTQQICIGRGLAAIRSSKSVDRDFLFYFLLYKQPEISGNTGAVFDSINKDQIASIEIPLPSLEKQRETVEMLDRVFAAIELLKKQIRTKKEYAAALRQSLLSSAFSQEEVVV